MRFPAKHPGRNATNGPACNFAHLPSLDSVLPPGACATWYVIRTHLTQVEKVAFPDAIGMQCGAFLTQEDAQRFVVKNIHEGGVSSFIAVYRIPERRG